MSPGSAAILPGLASWVIPPAPTIAAMLALDGRWLGGERARIRSAVGLAGPYDFLPLSEPVHETIFAAEPDLERTQPISFADATAPPLLLVSGRADVIVDPGNTARLATRIREHGGLVAERYYDRLGHAAVIGAMARPLRFIAPVLDEATAFLACDPATGEASAAA